MTEKDWKFVKDITTYKGYIHIKNLWMMAGRKMEEFEKKIEQERETFRILKEEKEKTKLVALAEKKHNKPTLF